MPLALTHHVSSAQFSGDSPHFFQRLATTTPILVLFILITILLSSLDPVHAPQHSSIMSSPTSDDTCSAENSTTGSTLSDTDQGETKNHKHYLYINEKDHPPATPEGVYLDGPEDDVESLEGYCEGGFHPVKIGDSLGESAQYRVLHKLGHGGYATVWLCRDTQNSRYVALKIPMARISADELEISSQLDCTLPGAEFIALPLAHFTFSGPNGTHHVLVLPVLGPRVSPEIWPHMKTNPNVALRRLACQAAQAMDFLHRNQICHGDFRPGNILINLASIDHLPETELANLIGPHRVFRVRHESDGDLPSSCPPCLVERCSLVGLKDYFTDKIKLIDFGESFLFSSPPKALGIPDSYKPPELLIGGSAAPGPCTDLWALGCTLFEVRQQIQLFYMLPTKNDIIAEIVRLFGKLPDSLWDKWDSRKKFFDDNAQGSRSEIVTLETFLARKLESWGSEPGVIWSSLLTPEAERKQLADLIYKLLKYEAAKRYTAAEALEHKWLKDAMKST
ncbi:hypothetical protein CEP54_013015 [Fusarium duplospermum]|uniref:EKC/KEOPS complex subunit BUD32 n=1 Tax=Fusarium duplospermum TaxID=1325734 RepID=A0A428P5E6_9HYPO|nr:hypothetical protein CEP54_013015 [Fusarium duplospermum]